MKPTITVQKKDKLIFESENFISKLTKKYLIKKSFFIIFFLVLLKEL